MTEHTPTNYETCARIVGNNDLSADAVAELLTACHRATEASAPSHSVTFLLGIALGAFGGYVATRHFFDDSYHKFDNPDSTDYTEVDAE
jgi:hypothetical protein